MNAHTQKEREFHVLHQEKQVKALMIHFILLVVDEVYRNDDLNVILSVCLSHSKIGSSSSSHTQPEVIHSELLKKNVQNE